MGKIKLTKGELKRQRDALSQYERYLPTLQLKKQQLQLEIALQLSILSERRHTLEKKLESVRAWAGLLAEPGIDLKPFLEPKSYLVKSRNIAGVDIPVYEHLGFPEAEYDLFLFPHWVDHAIDALRGAVALQDEISIISDGVARLRHELRITTQRVNLFEKVKIPDAQEAIRRIKIYIGDQMANAVGRSKIAKRKIESELLEGAAA